MCLVRVDSLLDWRHWLDCEDFERLFILDLGRGEDWSLSTEVLVQAEIIVSFEDFLGNLCILISAGFMKNAVTRYGVLRLQIQILVVVKKEVYDLGLVKLDSAEEGVFAVLVSRLEEGGDLWSDFS